MFSFWRTMGIYKIAICKKWKFTFLLYLLWDTAWNVLSFFFLFLLLWLPASRFNKSSKFSYGGDLRNGNLQKNVVIGYRAFFFLFSYRFYHLAFLTFKLKSQISWNKLNLFYFYFTIFKSIKSRCTYSDKFERFADLIFFWNSVFFSFLVESLGFCGKKIVLASREFGRRKKFVFFFNKTWKS